MDKRRIIMPKKQKEDDELQQVIEAGKRLGVEINVDKAKEWLEDIQEASKKQDAVAVDEKQGIYGHEVTLIDFDTEDLERYRRIADIVGIPDTEGVVETAISLSGSAAQGKVQRFPGDLDYFERVNIIASSREEACKIIGEVMRKKALDFFKAPTFLLIGVRWGSCPVDAFKKGKLKKEKLHKGSSIWWDPPEVKQGYILMEDLNGKEIKIDWNQVEKDPGWCKLDWIIAENEEGRIVNVSNMLDVTWEAPNGEIVPLDGYLDPYFQEVYIEKESIPLFTKLKKHLSPNELDSYVEALKGQVKKYIEKGHENYGKVAKRLYNIFRLIGAHKEAMYIRELFDEPAAALYQVWSLIDMLDRSEEVGVEKKILAKQATELIKRVIQVCEGDEETKIVDSLMKLRDDITGVSYITDEEWDQQIAESRFIVVKLVNEYFYARLKIFPGILAFIEEIQKTM